MNFLKTASIVTTLSLCIPQPFTELSAEGNHSHDFPKEIMAFHHVMAPLWHLELGAERTKLSCEATDKMLALTKDIANSKELVSAVTEMKKTCDNKADIEQDFKNIHDAFHKVSDQAK